MRIVFAIKSLNVVGGGAERVLVQVANGLARRGHQLSILTFDGVGDSFYPLDPEVSRLNLDIGPPGRPTPRWALLRALPRMRAAVLAESPDIVVGFMHSMYVPLGVALLGAGVPLVASEHSASHHFRSRPAQRWMVRLLSRIFVAKTVPSEAIRRQTQADESIPVVALANPLDLASYAAGRDSVPAEPPVLLSVGRFMFEKNQLELIAAFARLASEYPEWTLRLAGDGEMRPEIEAAIAYLGLSDRVELPGAVADMPGEYARATIVVMPSRYEAFGMVTAEAQSSARVVLGFADCPGTNELIQDGINGVLVPGDGDRVRSLEVGLRRLMDDASLRNRLAAAGPSSVARFSLDAVVSVWESFLVTYAKRGVIAANAAGRDA